MKIEPGRVRAPEIGRIWLNSMPLNLRQLRGKAVLIDFWDYTCINCLRTLPYVQQWHERYSGKGLVVIGIHTPEFTFAQYESNVERGVREFGLTYPIVLDSNYELWKAYANRYWPAKYLIGQDGYIRDTHFGEGGYAETEAAIQGLLREINSSVQLPAIMRPLQETDAPGAICYRSTPELYLGYKRGRIGNQSGFKADLAADYKFNGALQEDIFYLQGSWQSTAEHVELSSGEGRIVLPYSAGGVNLVMAPGTDPGCDVEIRQDGKPLNPVQATGDTKFSGDHGHEKSHLQVDRARMYALVDNHNFGVHKLEIICRSPGLKAYAFTFTNCIDPSGTGYGEQKTSRAGR